MANPSFQLSPFGNFDPSQWSNPYSKFQNQALPWPAQYSGWPTDAMGQPIQQPPGMTLNSSPAQPQPAAAAPAAPAPFRPVDLPPAGAYQWGNNQTGYYNPPNAALQQQQAARLAAQQHPAAQAAAAAAPNPAGLSSQQYLQLLANPGPVATPGATVPASASGWQPNNNVLQQFLQNWRPAQSGPGAGFQQGFANALAQGR